MKILRAIKLVVWISLAAVGVIAAGILCFIVYGASMDSHRGYPKDKTVQTATSPDGALVAELHKVEFDSQGIRDSVFVTIEPAGTKPWDKTRVYDQVYECDDASTLSVLWQNQRHLSIFVGKCRGSVHDNEVVYGTTA